MAFRSERACRLAEPERGVLKTHASAAAWPAVARAQTEEALQGFDTPYKNMTFQAGYSSKHVGRLGYAVVPGLKRRSVEAKPVPVLILDCGSRNRIHVIHGTDKELGFRLTAIDYGNVCQMTDEYVFDKYVENLSVMRYMQKPLEQRLIAKTKDELPRILKCNRCILA